MLSLLSLLLGCGSDTTVVIMNNGERTWESMTVLVNGNPACKTDLAPSETVTITEAGCEVSQIGEVDPLDDQGGEGEEKADEPRTLVLTAKVTGGIGPARRIGITNKTGYTWHNCSVTLNGKYTYRTITDLEPGEYEGVMGQKFKDSDGDMMTKTHQISSVYVACNEGTGSASPR